MSPGKRLTSSEADTKKTKKVKVGHFRDGTDKFLYYLSCVANVLAACMIPSFMFMFGKFVDSFGPSGNEWGIWLVAMAGSAIFMAVFCMIGYTSIELSAERQMRRLRADFLNEIMKQEIGYFDQFDATTLATQLSYHSIAIRDAIGSRLGLFVLYIGLALACVAYGLYEHWGMTLFCCITMPFIVAAGWYSTRVEIQVSRESRLAFEDAASTAQETLGAVKTVKAFGLESMLIKRFVAAIRIAYQTGIGGGRKIGLAVGLHWLMMFISFVVAFLWGIRSVANEMERRPECKPMWDFDEPWEMDPTCFSGGYGIAVMNTMVFGQFFLSKVSPFFTVRKKAKVAINEVVDLYSRESQINPYNPEGDKGRTLGAVEFRNVQFSYPTAFGRVVFKSLNLVIPAGKSVALVGASGCGKSTIIQLIERFYDVDGGEVLIDGIPIQDYNVAWLRDQMALVSQEPRLFADTIAANIGVGKRNASLDEIIQAAKDANAHEFIMQFPKGYDTFVGEGGGQLSGGQKQRIAIARAILRDPKILILDEATSALDNASEEIVQQTLNRIVESSSRTTIIVAHRLSSIKNADMIIVLDNPHGTGAEVAEIGTHDSLLKIPDGLYAALVAAQTGEGKTRDEYRMSLQTSADLASMYSADLAGRQQSIVKLTSKFSAVRERADSLRRSSTGQVDLFRRPSVRGQRLHRRTIEPLRDYKVRLILGCVGGILFGAVWPLFAVFYSYLVMAFLQTSPSEMWNKAHEWWWSFLLLGVISLVGNYLQTAMMEVCGQVVIRSIRTKTFQAMLRQDVAFYDDPRHSPGTLMGLLSGDAILLRGWAGDSIAVYCQCLTSLLIALIMSMTASWRLGLVALASMLITVPVSFYQSKMQKGGQVKVKCCQSQADEEEEKLDAQAIIHEVVLNIRTITAFNMQQTMSDRFERIVKKEYQQGKPKAYIGGALWGISQSLVLLIVVANMWYGVKLVMKDRVEPRGMIQAVLCLVFAAVNIGKAFTTATSSARAREAAERIYEVIDHKPIINDQSTSGRRLETIESVEFDRVSFRYPQRPDLPVYKEVTFKLPKGKVTALVGASGCGKSTAVQLLERFYDAFENDGSTILINNVPIQEFNVQALRSCIGLVGQEPVLFTGSVEENISYGCFDAAANDVIDAAQKANAHEFILKLSDGYQTDVGRGGSKLSGGQKQRIAIARALIRKPKLLILDEATSALDAESERIVQAALDDLLSNKTEAGTTTLVIAHRLSTIRRADNILVFNNEGLGSTIVEQGDHNQLMKISNGIYRGLVRIAEQR